MTTVTLERSRARANTASAATRQRPSPRSPLGMCSQTMPVSGTRAGALTGVTRFFGLLDIFGFSLLQRVSGITLEEERERELCVRYSRCDTFSALGRGPAGGAAEI